MTLAQTPPTPTHRPTRRPTPTPPLTPPPPLRGPRLDTPGTPESTWAAAALEDLPPLDIGGIGSHRRVVVVSPHPDDEVLAAGGILQRLAAGGTEVIIVSVTDGEASHPVSPTLTRAQLAALRADERAVALKSLGLANIGVVRLRLPDGAVAQHASALQGALRVVLGPDVACLAPWHADGHPDHDATGAVAATAAQRAGATLLQYLVWTWHWAGAGDGLVPWPAARVFGLSPGEQQRKEVAISAFGSQIAPLSDRPGDEVILPDPVLAHFRRAFEVFLI